VHIHKNRGNTNERRYFLLIGNNPVGISQWESMGALRCSNLIIPLLGSTANTMGKSIGHTVIYVIILPIF
jgi:hypothetical protein